MVTLARSVAVEPGHQEMVLEFAGAAGRQREAAVTNLGNLARDFDSYEEGMGFYDSVNLRTGHVSDRMLSLDQGMVAAALAQVLRPGLPQQPFRGGGFVRNLRPLRAQEDFAIV